MTNSFFSLSSFFSRATQRVLELIPAACGQRQGTALNDSPAQCRALHMWIPGQCSEGVLRTLPLVPEHLPCFVRSLNWDSLASQPRPLQARFFHYLQVRDYSKENWPHSDCSSITLPLLETLLLPPHSKRLIPNFLWSYSGTLGQRLAFWNIATTSGTFSWANCCPFNSGFWLIQVKVMHKSKPKSVSSMW